nr:MAG TPA: hypothetical protein [Caudoviricetes sp.]
MVLLCLMKDLINLSSFIIQKTARNQKFFHK